MQRVYRKETPVLMPHPDVLFVVGHATVQRLLAEAEHERLVTQARQSPPTPRRVGLVPRLTRALAMVRTRANGFRRLRLAAPQLTTPAHPRER